MAPSDPPSHPTEPRNGGLPIQEPDSFEHDEYVLDNIVPTRGYHMTPMVRLGGSAGSIQALQEFFREVPYRSRNASLESFFNSFEWGFDEKSLQRQDSLESWPMTPVFDEKERVALGLAEVLARPLPEESSLLPHLFHQAQQPLTRSDIVRIVVAVEAMQEWGESEIYVEKNPA